MGHMAWIIMSDLHRKKQGSSKGNLKLPCLFGGESRVAKQQYDPSSFVGIQSAKGCICCMVWMFSIWWVLIGACGCTSDPQTARNPWRRVQTGYILRDPPATLCKPDFFSWNSYGSMKPGPVWLYSRIMGTYQFSSNSPYSCWRIIRPHLQPVHVSCPGYGKALGSFSLPGVVWFSPRWGEPCPLVVRGVTCGSFLEL